ncbi:MAG: hypothetical protein IT510_10385 [Sulfuritalea sp.]|nr:hypothetical protein [Sulfuritalea sp.]
MQNRIKHVVPLAAAALLSSACADLDFLRAVNSGLQQYNSGMSGVYSASQGGGGYNSSSSDDAPAPSYQPTYQPPTYSTVPSNSRARANTQTSYQEDCSRLTGIYRDACECRQGRGRWAGAKACPVP